MPETKFSTYREYPKRGLMDRLRFLFTGKAWLRTDWDYLGRPVGVAIGYRLPADAASDPERDEQIRAEIAENLAQLQGMDVQGEIDLQEQIAAGTAEPVETLDLMDNAEPVEQRPLYSTRYAPPPEPKKNRAGRRREERERKKNGR